MLKKVDGYSIWSCYVAVTMMTTMMMLMSSMIEIASVLVVAG